MRKKTRKFHSLVKVKLIEARLNIVRVLVQYEMNNSSSHWRLDAGPVFFFSRGPLHCASIDKISGGELLLGLCGDCARLLDRGCTVYMAGSDLGEIVYCELHESCNLRLYASDPEHVHPNTLYSRAISCNLYCLAPFPVSLIPVFRCYCYCCCWY